MFFRLSPFHPFQEDWCVCVDDSDVHLEVCLCVCVVDASCLVVFVLFIVQF